MDGFEIEFFFQLTEKDGLLSGGGWVMSLRC
jgi:hypothetical protein